jgi:hypothetical protein
MANGTDRRQVHLETEQQEDHNESFDKFVPFLLICRWLTLTHRPRPSNDHQEKQQ